MDDKPDIKLKYKKSNPIKEKNFILKEINIY